MARFHHRLESPREALLAQLHGGLRVLGLAHGLLPVAAFAVSGEDAKAATRRVDLLISRTLRYGMFLSAILVVVGLAALTFAEQEGSGQEALSAVYAGNADKTGSFSSPIAVAQAVVRGDPNAVVTLGLLALIVLPLVPVVMSLIAYVLRRDKAFVAVTVVVIAIAVASFLINLYI
ncbi:MAG: DUF1634 domain-containing protein [Dehalococcoidales bacterium]|nr:DUF1634 domain-containing protein [Dehalococcoidales bacterium]